MVVDVDAVRSGAYVATDQLFEVVEPVPAPGGTETLWLLTNVRTGALVQIPKASLALNRWRLVKAAPAVPDHVPEAA